MTNKYVCGFDENGIFLSGCIYKDNQSLIRPKMLNRSVVLTEVVEQDVFDLYRQGYYRNEEGKPTEPEIPEPTQEELLEIAKTKRTEAVSKITVEVDGMVFDGDETSQARMSVASSTMTDDETNVWVLADNTVVQVTKAQLLQACRLARIAQSELWIKPYRM